MSHVSLKRPGKCKILSVESPINTMLCNVSHKPNPSSVPRGTVDSYSTLPWVMWEAVTVVEGISWWGLLQHTLANEAVVYPSQGGRYHAEGCMALGHR